MSKSVYVRVFNDLELLRYVLHCEIERQPGFNFPLGRIKYTVIVDIELQVDMDLIEYM